MLPVLKNGTSTAGQSRSSEVLSRVDAGLFSFNSDA